MKNKNFWIVIAMAVIIAIATNVYFVRKYQEVPPPQLVGGMVMEKKPVVPRVATTSPSVHLDDAKLAEMSIIQELSARWGALTPPLDVANEKQRYVKWTNAQGYTLMISAEESMIVVMPVAYPGTESGTNVPDTFFSEDLRIARDVFARRGFILNNLNSSTSTQDKSSYDYIQGYEKNDKHCTLTINSEIISYSGGGGKMGHLLTAVCAGSISPAEEEQIPLLDALNYRNTGMKVGYITREGAFISAGVFGDRGGQNAILKQEGSQYRLLLMTQEYPPCELVDKEKIPMSFLKTIGYNMCYKAAGGVRQF